MLRLPLWTVVHSGGCALVIGGGALAIMLGGRWKDPVETVLSLLGAALVNAGIALCALLVARRPPWPAYVISACSIYLAFDALCVIAVVEANVAGEMAAMMPFNGIALCALLSMVLAASDLVRSLRAAFREGLR